MKAPRSAPQSAGGSGNLPAEMKPAAVLEAIDARDAAPTPYFSTDSGRLYATDCLEVLGALPDESVDLVVTSPPYERQPKYENGETYDREWFEGPFLEITQQVHRVLRTTGQFVLNYRSRKLGVERSTLQFELIGWIRSQGFLFAEDHVWVKPSPPPGRYRQALKDGLEYCFRFAKTDEFVLYPEQCLAPARWDAKDRERRRKHEHNFSRVDEPSGHGRKRVQAGPDWVAPSNVLITEPEFSPNPAKHPARFPPAVPEFFIKLCTRPGELVLDPFSGTSTTAVVAEGLGRRWIMAELDMGYCSVLPGRLRDLAERMAKMPEPSEEVPKDMMWLPLPFSLPRPKTVKLRSRRAGPHEAAEPDDGLDAQQVGEIP